MASIRLADHTDTVQEKLRLLQTAYQSGRYDLALSLTESLKDTIAFEQQTSGDLGPLQLAADLAVSVADLPAGWASWALVVFAILISAALLIWMWRVNDRMLAIALGLVAGGAIGNVIDRLRFGAVVDFLDFYADGWHWPAFNLADTAITAGVVLLILDSLKSPPSKP